MNLTLWSLGITEQVYNINKVLNTNNGIQFVTI